MRDSTTDETGVEGFLIDGDAPRLGVPVLPQPSFTVPATPTAPLMVTPEATLAPPPPGSAPLLSSDSPSLPMPVLAAPVLSGITPSGQSQGDEGDSGSTEPRHPMAHLMPEKSKPSESSLRAAQLRAAKKAKARRKKIIAGVVMLAIAAVVGPPGISWLIDAVNEAGSTKTEEPATTTPDATTAPEATTAPDATTDAPGADGVAGLPGDAQDAVDATNADVTDVAEVTGTTVAP